MNSELDIFGKLLMKSFRDRALYQLDTLIEGKFNVPSLQKLQESLSTMNENDKEILIQTCIESLDSGIHDFLFALQESSDNKDGIEIIVNGKNIAELSDGLQGELFTEDGWFAKFSKYGEPKD